MAPAQPVECLAEADYQAGSDCLVAADCPVGSGCPAALDCLEASGYSAVLDCLVASDCLAESVYPVDWSEGPANPECREALSYPSLAALRFRKTAG